MAQKDHALAKETADQTQSLEKDKFAFEQETKTKEAVEKEKEKAKVKAESDAVSVLPKLDAAFAKMQKTLEKMLDVLENPPARSVSISNIEKQYANGELTGIGATVKPTLQ